MDFKVKNYLVFDLKDSLASPVPLLKARLITRIKFHSPISKNKMVEKWKFFALMFLLYPNKKINSVFHLTD